MPSGTQKGIATEHRPLEQVFERLETWFNNERQHRHEVRGRLLHARLKYELEYERDRQLVLEQQESKWFKEFVHQACQTKARVLPSCSPR